MNKNISVWKGNKTPPTNYHLWVKENNSIHIFVGNKWYEILSSGFMAKHASVVERIAHIEDNISKLLTKLEADKIRKSIETLLGLQTRVLNLEKETPNKVNKSGDEMTGKLKVPLIETNELLGNPTTTTAKKGTNNTQIATTEFVQEAVKDAKIIISPENESSDLTVDGKSLSTFPLLFTDTLPDGSKTNVIYGTYNQEDNDIYAYYDFSTGTIYADGGFRTKTGRVLDTSNVTDGLGLDSEVLISLKGVTTALSDLSTKLKQEITDATSSIDLSNYVQYTTEDDSTYIYSDGGFKTEFGKVLDEGDITSTTGLNTSLVMSLKAVTDAIAKASSDMESYTDMAVSNCVEYLEEGVIGTSDEKSKYKAYLKDGNVFLKDSSGNEIRISVDKGITFDYNHYGLNIDGLKIVKWEDDDEDLVVWQSDLTTTLANYAPLASPALTGTPTAPTAAKTTNNTQIATTAFVQTLAKGMLPFNDSYISNANTWLTNGYTKTRNTTTNLPTEKGTDSWGILFFIAENATNGTGTQMFFPIDGTQKGRVFTRSLTRMKAGGTPLVGEWNKLVIPGDLSKYIKLNDNNEIVVSQDGEDYVAYMGYNSTGAKSLDGKRRMSFEIEDGIMQLVDPNDDGSYDILQLSFDSVERQVLANGETTSESVVWKSDLDNYVSKLNKTILFTPVDGFKIDKIEVIDSISLLPDGYKELEYLESDGNAVINTGYIPKHSVQIETDFMLTQNISKTYAGIFGAYGGDEQQNTVRCIFTQNGLFMLYNSCRSASETISNIQYRLNTKHHISLLSLTDANIDGTQITISPTQGLELNSPLYLFTANYGWSCEKGCRFYNFKIEDDGTPIRNMIPCINPSGEYGMYDTVENKFYGNANNTGSFTGVEKVIKTGHANLMWQNTDGTTTIENMWKAGDQALCLTFNSTENTSYRVVNKYYWILVTDAGYTDDGYNYITVDPSVCDGIFNPGVGDEITMLGYRGNDTERQSAIYISAYNSLDEGLIAPLFATYKGINDFNLATHRDVYFAANTSTSIATTTFVLNTLSKYTTTKYVDDALEDLTTGIQEYVDDAISNFTPEYYSISEIEEMFLNAEGTSVEDLKSKLSAL